MSDKINEQSLETLTGALAYAMGVEPPKHAAEANADLAAYIDRVLEGEKVDRIFMYNADAIGQWVYEKYPYWSEEARERIDLELPMRTANPPQTPVCFATMYTGAAPAVHGLEKYEKKTLAADTLFDALARAGKKVALVTQRGYSMTVLFLNRDIDYYFYDTWAEVNAKAVELVIRDEYDFILTYNAHYDDILHKKGPESKEALAEMRFNYHTYCMFDALIQNHWGKHNTLIGFGMDHGCHEVPETSGGDHGLYIPEDMNILHLYKIHHKSI